jgi:hypothetical protein
MTEMFDRVRYRHLGPDPLAKQLYANLVAAVRAAEAAETSLLEYLDSPQARAVFLGTVQQDGTTSS